MAGRTQDKYVPSESIRRFVCAMTTLSNEYILNSQEVNRLDKLTQDYLHKLELEDLKYRDRAKVATALSLCRQQRREAKDMVDILTPIHNFIESESGKKTLNNLKNILGQTRKEEERKTGRHYIYKVLEE